MLDSERAAHLVAFWRTVEMFAPQSVPGVSPPRAPGKDDAVVLDLGPGRPAPWEAGHPLLRRALPEHLTWQFVVYGGLYEVAAVHRGLDAVFGPDRRPADARRDERTAVFGFTLTADGSVVENSATLSACAWAMSRLRSPGPDDPTWLDGFGGHQAAFTRALNRLSPEGEPSDAPVETLKAAAGRKLKTALRDAAGAGAKATGTAVTTAVGTGLGSLAGPIVGGIAGQIAGKFTESLLTPAAAATEDKTPAEPRIDLTADALLAFTGELVAALDPSGVLGARGVRVWCRPVSKTGTANGQDFLNSAIADDLADIESAVREGTCGAALRTYLADERTVDPRRRIDTRTSADPLLAGVEPDLVPGARWPTSTASPLFVSQQFAVDRIMLELRDRSGIFAVNGPPGTGKTTMLRDVLAAVVLDRARRLAALESPADAYGDVVDRVRLGGYTAVVRALEPEVTGFEIVVATASNNAAANVTAELPGLGAVSGGEPLGVGYFPELASHLLDAPAWGLIAAVLGKAQHRRAFGSGFWWGGDGVPGMLKILGAVHDAPPTAQDWADAVKAFTTADAEVRRLAGPRQEAARALAEYRVQQRIARDAEAAVLRAFEVCRGLSANAATANRHEAAARTAFDEADREYAQWHRIRPHFLQHWFGWFKAMRRWGERESALADERFTKRQTRLQCEHQARHARAELEAAQAEHARSYELYQHAQKALADLEPPVAAAEQRWPGFVPSGPEFADDQRFQLCAPWSDPEFTAARNRLFLAALSLHKAFLFGGEQLARGNLAVVSAMLQGKRRLEPRTALAVWQSLFLVVPVVSTTFASLPRLFSGIGAESLGWLFVDEAGQATPQQVVGGLWRCRRGVLLGDPRQLEPISAVPGPAQEALRRHHRVDEQWTADALSAQGVADRHARHGTYLASAGGQSPVWIGAPLRVHRRCDRPMFEVSNRIAYGGDLMIYGTPSRCAFPDADKWIDVPAGEASDNWLPAEGAALVSLVHQLLQDGVKPAAIRVVSPFRAVVAGCRARVSAAAGGPLPVGNIGTVHTVQGQESDVVILVLGTPAGKAGARNWVAEKPNLLNVAVSRAKRRFYVIGDRGNWENLRHFDVLAAVVPADR